MAVCSKIWFMTVQNLLLVSIFIFIVPASIAGGIDNLRIEDRIDGDDLRETLWIRIHNNSADEIILRMPPHSTDIIVNNKSYKDPGSIREPLSCVTCFILVEFRLPSVVKKEDDHLIYTRTLEFEEVNKLNYTVFLPLGYTIVDDKMNPPVVPEQTALLTSGRDIRVNWVMENPDLPAAFMVRYHHIHSERSYAYLYIIGVLVLAVITLSIFLYRASGKRQVCRIPDSVLSSDENAVIAALTKHSEESSILRLNFKPLTQKEIGQKLGWSKSKTSTVISALERKKLLKREPFGRNFRVTLERLKSEPED